MVRKSILGLVAAATIAFGMAAAVSPASAKVYISLGFGHPYYYHGYRHHCGTRFVNVKVWSHRRHKWVRVRQAQRYCW